MNQVASWHKLLPTYARLDVTFVDGDGAWLVDADGKRYLDLFAGIAVVGLGHGHPAPLAAAHAQLDRLWHVSNLYWTEPMGELADALSERFGGAQAFFCNSGAESIEAALKWARKATGRSEVVTLEGSFHGRTFGALSVTGQPAKRAAFEPLVPGARFATQATLAEHVGPDTAAILLEPVQGEGGRPPARAGNARLARELADEHGALLILDEMQTGVGRSGAFFAWETSAFGRMRSRSRRGWQTGCRSGRCSSPTRRRARSSRAITPQRSAATSSPAPLPVPCSRPRRRPARRTCAQRSAQLAEGLAPFGTVRGLGLLLAVELDRPVEQPSSRPHSNTGS